MLHFYFVRRIHFTSRHFRVIEKQKKGRIPKNRLPVDLLLRQWKANKTSNHTSNVRCRSKRKPNERATSACNTLDRSARLPGGQRQERKQERALSSNGWSAKSICDSNRRSDRFFPFLSSRRLMITRGNNAEQCGCYCGAARFSFLLLLHFIH